MKKIVFIAVILVFSMMTYAQEKPDGASFELGNGLEIRGNKGAYVFNIGGYIQADAQYLKEDPTPAEYRFGIRRAFLHTSGSLFQEKMSFLLQLDVTDPYPLLDAWAAYHFSDRVKVSVGQKQSFSGTRSMMFYDKALALGDRSLADETFFASGRELGAFVESKFPLGTAGLRLDAAITSGDGRNSFGTSSTDFDLGGAKYSGRATIYPLGFFTGDNDLTGTDFVREERVKIALGSAFSYNDGASNKIGEGHGDFTMYNSEGKIQFPGYQKISVDMLLKYRGFTLLSEYINAVGADLQDLYLTPSVNSKLVPKQIADYLVLGDGLNLQAGYLSERNWALDVRYSQVTPEWEENSTLIKNNKAYTVGLSKYFKDNRMKVQLLGTYRDEAVLGQNANNNTWQAAFVTHIVF